MCRGEDGDAKPRQRICSLAGSPWLSFLRALLDEVFTDFLPRGSQGAGWVRAVRRGLEMWQGQARLVLRSSEIQFVQKKSISIISYIILAAIHGIH